LEGPTTADFAGPKKGLFVTSVMVKSACDAMNRARPLGGTSPEYGRKSTYIWEDPDMRRSFFQPHYSMDSCPLFACDVRVRLIIKILCDCPI